LLNVRAWPMQRVKSSLFDRGVKDHDALIDPTRMHSTPRRLGVNVRWNAAHRRLLSHVVMLALLSYHTRDTVAARTLAARSTRTARASPQQLASFRCAFVSFAHAHTKWVLTKTLWVRIPCHVLTFPPSLACRVARGLQVFRVEGFHYGGLLSLITSLVYCVCGGAELRGEPRKG
jgi:hypothetical protein